MIREAQRRDAEDIERLYRILLPNNTVRVWPDRVEQISHNPHSFLLVVEREGRVLATGHLHLCLDALTEDRPFGVVERVIVDPAEQGRGYGTALMKHIERICEEHRCVKVMLTSNAKRLEAHHFYRSLGYDGEGSKAFKKYIG
jgi:GNAT superfamily N-acetyltransferase